MLDQRSGGDDVPAAPPQAGTAATVFAELRGVVTLPLRRAVRPAAAEAQDRTALWMALFAAAGLVVAGFFAFHVDPATPVLRGLFPSGWMRAARRFTELGNSGYVLWPAFFAILAMCWLRAVAGDGTVRALAASVAMRAYLVFVAVALPGLLVTLAKRVIGRARPEFLDSLGQFAFTPFATSAKFASFPSGHSTTSFAFALVMSLIYPALRVPLFALAASVAASRVVVGAHYPSDVVAGAGIGIALAWLVVRAFAERGLVVSLARDGSIRPARGRPLRRLVRLVRARPGAYRTRFAASGAADAPMRKDPA